MLEFLTSSIVQDFWLDGGITNTVHVGYFTHDKVLDNLENKDKITFVAFHTRPIMKFMDLIMRRCVNLRVES